MSLRDRRRKRRDPTQLGRKPLLKFWVVTCRPSSAMANQSFRLRHRVCQRLTMSKAPDFAKHQSQLSRHRERLPTSPGGSPWFDHRARLRRTGRRSRSDTPYLSAGITGSPARPDEQGHVLTSNIVRARAEKQNTRSKNLEAKRNGRNKRQME